MTLCQDLIAIPSENPPGAHYRPCITRLRRELDHLGLEHQLIEVPGDPDHPRANLLAFHGSGHPTVYFHGHYDVVPAQRRAQFEPVVRDGRLYGRGATDMKTDAARRPYELTQTWPSEALRGLVDVARMGEPQLQALVAGGELYRWINEATLEQVALTRPVIHTRSGEALHWELGQVALRPRWHEAGPQQAVTQQLGDPFGIRREATHHHGLFMDIQPGTMGVEPVHGAPPSVTGWQDTQEKKISSACLSTEAEVTMWCATGYPDQAALQAQGTRVKRRPHTQGTHHRMQSRPHCSAGSAASPGRWPVPRVLRENLEPGHPERGCPLSLGISGYVPDRRCEIPRCAGRPGRAETALRDDRVAHVALFSRIAIGNTLPEKDLVVNVLLALRLVQAARQTPIKVVACC